MWTICLSNNGWSARGRQDGRLPSPGLWRAEKLFFAVTELVNSVTERRQYYVHHHIPIRRRPATKIQEGSDPCKPGTGVPWARIEQGWGMRSYSPLSLPGIRLYIASVSFLVRIFLSQILNYLMTKRVPIS